MITTTGVAVTWAAFLMFGKKRRDEEQPAPDPVLEARAASPYITPSAGFAADATPGSVPWGVDPSEASLPRWRRPSLLEARKTDPLRAPTRTETLTFESATASVVEGAERRRIRYRLVRLLDVPDEVRANEIGIVDEGDEVQLIERCGTYWLVVCPDGQQGWLHKMVLGDVVEDPTSQVEIDMDPADAGILQSLLAERLRTA